MKFSVATPLHYVYPVFARFVWRLESNNMHNSGISSALDVSLASDAGHKALTTGLDIVICWLVIGSTHHIMSIMQLQQFYVFPL